ncbi:MAG: DUF4214 domain-containing protein [Burkholderiales bacterium]|nr:DUF4214 domain-containing protein [Burkholderiales bacterium]
MPGQVITTLAIDNNYYPNMSISDDGRYLAFISTLDPNNPTAANATSTQSGIFIKDMQGGVRFVQDLGEEGLYRDLALSGNGGVIAFASTASNLVPNSPPASGWVSGIKPPEILLKNWQTGALQLASSSANGSAANGFCNSPTLTLDGNVVAFSSIASNLVASDSNGTGDVFVKNMQTGQITIASTASDGTQGNRSSDFGKISDDGRYCAFESAATNLIPGITPTHTNVYWKDLQTGALSLVSSDTDQASIRAISGNGRYVVFQGYEAEVNQPVSFSLYEKDMVTGKVVNVGSNAFGISHYTWQLQVSVSNDGRYVAFADNFSYFTSDDHNSSADIYLKDTQTGGLARIVPSTGEATGPMAEALISGNSSTLVFRGNLYSSANSGLYIYQSTLPTLQDSVGNDNIAANLTSNKYLDGGSGTDTAVYSGALAKYTVTRSNGNLLVTASNPDPSNLGGPITATDNLHNIERIKFDDASRAYDIDGNAGQAYRIYQAAFNRTPDKSGLSYWINTMDKGASLTQVAQGFTQAAEFTTLYGSSPSNSDIVNKFYQNVLHRPAETSGYQYWLNLLEQHTLTSAYVLASFAESVENKAALIGVIQNGIDYTPL